MEDRDSISLLRVMVVDAEPLERMRLRGLLADCRQPAARVVAEAPGACGALHRLSSEPVDLVMTDIRLPGLDGFQFAERLRDLAAPPKVVFVSTRDDHALRAFELDAVDYLTKPVRPARLQQCLRRVAERFSRADPPLPWIAAEPACGVPALVVRHRGRLERVPLTDILYLKAEMKYVTLRSRARAFILEDSLAELERRLRGWVLRVHRNALVMPGAIARLQRRPEAGEGWAVQVDVTGEWLPVSRRLLAPVRLALAGAGL